VAVDQGLDQPLPHVLRRPRGAGGPPDGRLGTEGGVPGRRVGWGSGSGPGGTVVVRWQVVFLNDPHGAVMEFLTVKLGTRVKLFNS